MLRKTEPDLVTFYDIRPRNGAGLFLQPWSPHVAYGTQEDDDTTASDKPLGPYITAG